MIRLYDFLVSGNSYKVRLLLNHLDIAFERIEVDIDAGQTRTPEFLAINPNGKIPALLLDDGQVLVESNAILFYFGDGTAYLPVGRLDRARTLQWMFFEQYSHEPYIAVSRFVLNHLEATEENLSRVAGLRERGDAALKVMEDHLAGNDFMVAGAYSLADISLYAYTHVAEEGEFALEPYPAIRRWIDRVANQPGHIPITLA